LIVTFEPLFSFWNHTTDFPIDVSNSILLKSSFSKAVGLLPSHTGWFRSWMAILEFVRFFVWILKPKKYKNFQYRYCFKNIICRQNWYQSKSDCMDRGLVYTHLELLASIKTTWPPLNILHLGSITAVSSSISSSRLLVSGSHFTDVNWGFWNRGYLPPIKINSSPWKSYIYQVL
jgi:hypothetical protein